MRQKNYTSMGRRALRVISLLLMCVILAHTTGFSLPVAQVEAQAATSEEMRDRLAELQRQQEEARRRIEAANKKIEEGQDVANAAQARRNALAAERAAIEEQITLIVAQIDLKVAEIDQKAIEIGEKQAEFDASDKLFRQRLVAIYKMNDASMLSTVLSVTTFSEFLSMTKNLQNISKHDTELLQTLEKQREELEAAKAEMEVLLADLEADRASLQQKWDEYSANIAQEDAAISAALQQIAQNEAEKDAALAEIEKAQGEMEQLWKDLGGASSGQYVGGALAWPVPSHNGKQYISSYYGWRTLYGRQNFHTGIDIARGPQASIAGSTIVPANSGTVVFIQANSNVGYGNYVIIDHGGGIKTLYAHCDKILVSMNQFVTRSVTPIATVGNTGNSTGPHLHFELRINNTEKIDPLPYVTGAREL